MAVSLLARVLVACTPSSAGLRVAVDRSGQSRRRRSVEIVAVTAAASASVIRWFIPRSTSALYCAQHHCPCGAVSVPAWSSRRACSV
ncbi:MAG: hypothetical protein ACRDSO_15800, partial [Pseudonocardiaceae bacterium]